MLSFTLYLDSLIETSNGEVADSTYSVWLKCWKSLSSIEQVVIVNINGSY